MVALPHHLSSLAHTLRRFQPKGSRLSGCLACFLAAALLTLTGCGFSLMLAAERGDTPQIRALLDDGVDVNTTLPFAGTRALILCAGRGNLEAVRLLLERGADVDATDMTGWTALHAAASQGHKEIVELLLTHGANTTYTNAILDKPLRWAEATKQVEIAELLKMAESAQDARRKAVAQNSSPLAVPPK